MSRKPLGPPPDWIAPEPNEQNGQSDPNPPIDPLRSIFSEARAVRMGEAEELSGVLRLARDRAQQIRPDAIAEEIKRRLREETERGDFTTVYAAPAFTADVPDSRDVRLVIFGPSYWHAGSSRDSRARRAALSFLQQRGAGPRRYANSLVFLAPDQAQMGALQEAVRDHLAWKALAEERQNPEHDADQANVVRAKRESIEEEIRQRLLDAYQWLLVPTCASPSGPLVLEEIRLQGSEPLAVRAGSRLEAEGRFFTRWTGSQLRQELERFSLWTGDHVSVVQLADTFARYAYLPRLRDSQVLLDAIREGLALPTWSQDAFAYAFGWDELRGRYNGLGTGHQVRVTLDSRNVLVKPEVALRQMAAMAAASARPSAVVRTRTSAAVSAETERRSSYGAPGVEAPRPRRFRGSVPMDALNFGRDAGKIRLDLVEHLNALPGASVKITLEIEASVPGGVPEDVVRTVLANCRTLQFTDCRFEND